MKEGNWFVCPWQFHNMSQEKNNVIIQLMVTHPEVGSEFAQIKLKTEVF